MEKREKDHFIYSERFALGAVSLALMVGLASLTLNVAVIVLK